MKKADAVELVCNTFEAPFERGQFVHFVRELLNSFDEEKAHKWKLIKNSFEDYVDSWERVGVYEQAEQRIDILIVHLKKETSLERARTMQRNFVAGYLRGDYGSTNEKDAALVAFVSADPVDWRFSLVKLEFAIEETEKGQLKGIEKFTPARRWSFLVGAHEKSHTAQTQLEPILADDESNPTLASLEAAFDIETVSDEFFDEYRRLFIETKSALDDVLLTEASLKSEFDAKQINSVDFAKKLLGQIVFLYYLQKKGWFGVPKDGQWGEGSKSFLRELFEKKHGAYHNFFNDVLESLFYEALRRDRSDVDHYYSRFDCKIPFLNGGLFDPIGDYDWWERDLLLPNALFANDEITNGDTGTGILDVFDRYNFTVREDEPFEKEVAIDPELLGKAYEKFNAIRPDNFDEYQAALSDGKGGSESKFNKKFGVYYTPREIVHYMCQQSLIQYLHTALNEKKTYRELGSGQQGMFGNEIKRGQLAMTAEADLAEISLKDIEDLILRGERIKENDARVVSKGRETPDYKFEIPDSIRLYASRVDEALAAVKVCDPAVGSGAFPVGMMNEIVKARDVLRVYGQTDQTHEFFEKASTYQFKRACIENSLYGVDIDPGAVEIAKLRLWLSLIVDEEDPQNIKPLPNLDYKLMQGNSLLGLPQEALLSNEMLTMLEEQKKAYFDETHPTRKTQFRKEINALFAKLVESARQFDPTLQEISFDFRTHFSEVFHEKDGYDIVIGNPPYIGEKGNEAIFHPIANSGLGRKYYSRWMDYFYYFFHKGLDITRNGSLIIYITTNYYFTATGAKKLRNDLKGRAEIVQIVDFGELKIFSEATGQHNAITFLQKSKQKKIFAENIQTERRGKITPEILASIISGSDERTKYFRVKQSGLFEDKDNSLRLAGYGDYSALPINLVLEKVKKQPYRLGDISDVLMGLVTRADRVSSAHFKIDPNLKASKGDGIFIISNKELKDLKLTKSDVETYVRPYFKNSDISRYYSKEKNKLWLLYLKDTGHPINLSDELNYHFSRYRVLLTKLKENFLKNKIAASFVKKWLSNGNYFVLFNPKEEAYFTSPKIVAPYRSKTNTFAYNDISWFASQDVCFILQSNKDFDLMYLLAILNSKLILEWLKKKGKKKGNILELMKKPLSDIPIPKPNPTQKYSIIEIVNQIIRKKTIDENANTNALERQLDALVYELYGLTEEEIAVVEGREVDSSAQPNAKPDKKEVKAPAIPVKVVEKKAVPVKKQVSPSDYGLYKCSECGSFFAGYEREEHVNEVHEGQDVEWVKMGGG
jgi:hypothetical protein